MWNHGKDMVKHIAKFWTRCLFTCKHQQRCRESCYIPATEPHRRRNRPPANTKPAAFSGSRLAHEDMNGSTRYSNMAGQYKWRLERLGQSSNLVDLTCRDPAKIEGNWRCNQSTLCGAPSCRLVYNPHEFCRYIIHVCTINPITSYWTLLDFTLL